MKSTKRTHTRTDAPASTASGSRSGEESGAATPVAFYIMMGALGIALLFFLGVLLFSL